MPLLLAVSSSHFLLVSSTPFIRSDDLRMFVRHGCPHNLHVHTTISPAILPPSQSVCLFLIVAGSLRHSVHIQKTHASHFLTRTSHPVPLLPTLPNHIYPLPNPNNAVLSGRSSSPPFLVVFQGVILWLGPIDCVCVPVIAQLRCVTSDGSRTCTIFFVHLRLSRYLKASIPCRDS